MAAAAVGSEPIHMLSVLFVSLCCFSLLSVVFYHLIVTCVYGLYVLPDYYSYALWIYSFLLSFVTFVFTLPLYPFMHLSSILKGFDNIWISKST